MIRSAASRKLRLKATAKAIIKRRVTHSICVSANIKKRAGRKETSELRTWRLRKFEVLGSETWRQFGSGMATAPDRYH